MKTIFLSLGLLMLFNNPTTTKQIEMQTTVTYCHQTRDACSKNGTYKKNTSNVFTIAFGQFFKGDTLKVLVNDKVYYHGIVNTIISKGRSDRMVKYNFKASEKKIKVKIVIDSKRLKLNNHVTNATLDLSYNQVLVSLISGNKWIFDHNNHDLR